MYKWIIIGGGVQGSCVATRLLVEKVKQEDLLIIDPYPEPMWMWRTLTEKIGMQYLRSPFVHHIAAEPYSLKRYSQKNDYAQPFKGTYSRPRLDMFNQHSLDEIDRAGVRQCWRQGTVEGLSWAEGVWNVTFSSNQEVQGEKVVLAVGVNQEPHYPEWITPYKNSTMVTHIFDLEKPLPDQGNVVIVGGGMTAAHLVNTLAKSKSIDSVNLVKRHPIRIHKFDSDPGWLGPKYLTKYNRLDCYQERRKLIQQARNRGSMTRDLYLTIKKHAAKGRVNFYTGEIEEAKIADGMIELLMTNEAIVKSHSLILATGAAVSFPGKEWVQPVIEQLELPCAPCGFPIVSRSLEWKKGLFVAGALAELEIGPVSRNIAGARKAAERIAQNA